MAVRRKRRLGVREVALSRAWCDCLYGKYIYEIWESMQEAFDDPKVKAARIAYFKALAKKLAEPSRGSNGAGT